MKKLNNKGITTIEVIISFVLVVIISASLFTTISAYNAKRLTESYKSQIYTYKNQLTKIIQDDLIKKGLVEVTYKKYTSASDTSKPFAFKSFVSSASSVASSLLSEVVSNFLKESNIAVISDLSSLPSFDSPAVS